MSNLDKANSVAHEWVESMSGLEAIRHDHGSDLSGLVQALDDTGLLAPDLPPYAEADTDKAWWYAETYGIGVDRLTKNSPLRITLWDSEPGGVLYTDTESARDYALKILAACEYAEKEQGNE